MSVLLLFALTTAAPALPMSPYPDCAEDARDQCPPDFGDWELTSWIPEHSQDTIREAERDAGSGLRADRALRLTAGRFDVTVAVIDSGIVWSQDRLNPKVRLHTGELPPPQRADGSTVDGYDLDGNGLVNIDDYAEDARVDISAGVDVADHLLDPSDLIHTFSDGVDDDGNGYPDDIAGWDFFGWDNDPFAELQSGYYSHGTGVAKTAVEGGEDGGGMGVCPNCSMVPLRVGDAFITDGDRVALALLYAADLEARVATMAIGALTHARITSEAVRYAEDHGLVMVAAAGDENSYHHNLPAMQSPILYVHSVRGSSDEGAGGLFSYLNFFNCNNYGPRVDLVAGTADCATGSVALIGGAAGLLVSAGRDAGIELDPGEVRSLLRTTAFDVWLSEEDLSRAGTYPSREGWDAFYGYGRVDVGTAVERVFAGEIPPVARLDGPGWFDQVARGTVEVRGRVEAPRSAVASWELSIGRGAEPGKWTSVASGHGAVDGTLATIDLTLWDPGERRDLGNDDVVERMVRAHEPLAQVRLVVTDTGGRSSEDRVGFWVRGESGLLSAFPLALGASAEASPVLEDLDGDGIFEIVLAASDGTVHAIRGDGSALPGFPVATRTLAFLEEVADPRALDDLSLPGDGVAATPAVGDLDGDGIPEVVVATLRGRVFAWHADGSEVTGFPVAIDGRHPEEFGAGMSWDNGIAAAPTLVDVDGDGALEVLVAALDQRLYLWDGGGGLLPGWPLELCGPETCDVVGARIMSSPAVGDLDGDGDVDAVLGTNEVPPGSTGLLYVVDLASASVWDGWPIERDGLIHEGILPLLGEGHPSSVAIADLDADGDLEIASNAMLGTGHLLHHDGSAAVTLRYTADGFGSGTNFTEGSVIAMATNPAFGDMDLDGVPDYLLGGASAMYLVSLPSIRNTPFQHALAGWSGADGSSLRGFPRQVDDVSFLVAPAVADLTGDGWPEAVYGTGGFYVYAWDHEGNLATGFPHHTGGWMVGSPAVGDIDGDGWLEVVVATREGWLFAWRTDGPADQDVQWASLHHDPRNTGNLHSGLTAQAGPEPEAGCCRRRARSGRASALILLILPLTWRRRRG